MNKTAYKPQLPTFNHSCLLYSRPKFYSSDQFFAVNMLGVLEVLTTDHCLSQFMRDMRHTVRGPFVAPPANPEGT